MKCIEEFINMMYGRFPIGNALCVETRLFYEEHEKDRESWIKIMSDAAEKSTNLETEFGITSNKVVDEKIFANKFTELTGIPTYGYFCVYD